MFLDYVIITYQEYMGHIEPIKIRIVNLVNKANLCTIYSQYMYSQYIYQSIHVSGY